MRSHGLTATFLLRFRFRVANLAGAGEVLVSNTVKALVAGSGITFTERGTHILRGIPGEWRLFTPDVPMAHAPTS